MLLVGLPRNLEPEEHVAAYYRGSAFQVCIEKETDTLTAQQIKEHHKEVETASYDELVKWVDTPFQF